MNQTNAGVLVFRTNLSAPEKIAAVRPLLDEHPDIRQWNVDRQDVDCVLRVVPHRHLPAKEVEGLLKENGFLCEELPD